MTFNVIRFKFITVPFAATKYTYLDGREYREFFVFGIRIAAWLL